MRKKGSITIPKEIRKRYQLHENDPLTLIDIGDGIFISPKHAVLPKLVNEIEDLRKQYNVSLEELIQGVVRERTR